MEIPENEELNLRSDNVTKCEDTILAVKEFFKIIKCKRKEILNLVKILDFYLRHWNK